MLTDKEKEILNCIVDGWDEYSGAMIGDASYLEVFEVLEKLGLKRPERLYEWLRGIDEGKDVRGRGAKDEDKV